MTEESFDCVEMKRQIQERLRGQRPREPLSAWNETVRAALRGDPHLRRFEESLTQVHEPHSRKTA